MTGSYRKLSHNSGFRLRQNQSKVFKLTCLATCLTAALSLTGCDSNNAQEHSTKQNTELVSAAQNADYLLPHSVFKKYSVDGVHVIETEENNKTVKNKLELSFPKDVHMPSITFDVRGINEIEQFTDNNLAFDVDNYNETSLHLYVDILHGEEVKQRHSVSIPANYQGTVFFPFSGEEASADIGFWGDPPSWNSEELRMIWRSWKKVGEDYQGFDQVRFLVIGNLETKTMGLSNVRFRKNPETNPLWLSKLVDMFGQSTRVDNNVKVTSNTELRERAQREAEALSSAAVWNDRSQYGGWKKGPKQQGTGFFRTQKVNGQWWMVDPEGYLFFSHGPANVRMANTTTYTGMDYNNSKLRKIDSDELTPEDSIDIVSVPKAIRETATVISKVRRDMFEWLPSYDDPLAKHYSYRRTSHKGPIEHGETFSFYRANLERKYGDEYLSQWEDITIKRMHEWGFTSFGNWVDPMFYDSERIPYFANGWIIGEFKTLSGHVNHWGEMPDPFDPEFAKRARVTIEKIAEEVNGSPWCAGIFIDNEKSWGEREGSVQQKYGVILDGLSKNSKDSPAKQAFSIALRDKYKTIDNLNNAWQTDYPNWQYFETGVNFNTHGQNLISDLSMLLELLGEQYFSVVHNTLEDVLPHHLYMGARMANWGMPDEIIKASLKYSDALSFNIYEEGMQPEFWAFLDEIDLPVVIGEFHIGTATDSGLYNPGIVHASDQTDRARMYTEYMESVISKPYMVGAHWFQYIDEPITGRAHDGENANIGLVTVADMPYPELIEAMTTFNKDLYKKKFDKKQ
ncbi:agarase [Alteromonas macleodii]|uniref:Beta-agarase, family GH50 n=1 Tax=Alteromonas macleodii TaxID=28108 RepID=A0A6T9Y0X1_ALTMA|nr:agarase [Alteromonas macleodii]CAB9493635.1 Beta-agarase, family GH50 [Alteromonas macleodii]